MPANGIRSAGQRILNDAEKESLGIFAVAGGILSAWAGSGLSGPRSGVTSAGVVSLIFVQIV